jgi:hypothetical protein
MEKKIARFYIMGETAPTITDSQVFNWMEVLNKNGYPTSIISFIKKIDENLDFERVNKKTGGKYYQYKSKNTFFNFIYYYRIFKKHYLNASMKADKVIFQTRTSGVALPLLLLKIFTNAKIIYDARGLSIEEFRHVNRGKKLGLKRRFKFNLLRLNEWLLIKKSNHVFSVSKLQQEYYLSKYNGLKTDNFEVVPCAADHADFYFDINERIEKRKEYGFKDEKVLLYSGRLYTGWAVPDEIFNFYNKLAKEVDNVVLFLLTPDINIAHEMKKRFDIDEEKIFITADSYQNVRKYLNMADYGILLRDDTLMNNIAAPTKVAEYMLCGLPLIISKNIKEVSDVIIEKSFGTTVDNYNVDDEIVRIISGVNHDRKEIALWAENNLSKGCFVEKIVQTFQTI